jgi:DtxR family Mn-dependent transcriptional regulator
VVSHYLEAIFYIWNEGEAVRSARLADWLSVSRPTVTVAVRRMSRDGLARLNARKEIELTAKGRRMAESIVRRHRIMERWLTDGLGLDWVTADEEAARLEHAVSDVVEKRLYEVLGRPSTCPHGNPIPGSHHAAPAGPTIALAEATPGPVNIARVSERLEMSDEALNLIAAARLMPGCDATVVTTDADGVTVKTDTGEHRVPARVADSLYVSVR